MVLSSGFDGFFARLISSTDVSGVSEQSVEDFQCVMKRRLATK